MLRMGIGYRMSDSGYRGGDEAVLLVAVLASSAGAKADYLGKVTAVVDGDTFTMEAAARTAPTSDLASGVYDAIMRPGNRPRSTSLRLFRHPSLAQSIFPSRQHLRLPVRQAVLDVLDPKIRVACTH